jgi:hypothetical protein
MAMNRIASIILRAVRPPCGRATRAVLFGLCRGEIDRKEFDAAIAALIKSKRLRKYGGRKDATYGLPVRRKRAAA